MNIKSRNPSLALITESKAKTISSISEQNYSFHEETTEHEFKQIKKWYKKKQLIGYSGERFIEDVKKASVFYLVKVEELMDIVWKKVSNGRLFLRVVVNLMGVDGRETVRTLTWTMQELESQSAHSTHYKLTDPISLYFHTKQTEGLLLVLNLLLFQSSKYDNNELISSTSHLAYVQIDPLKGSKTKQKCQLISPKTEVKLDATMGYSILTSDSMKVLEKLIPAECVVGGEDLVGGLAGRRLPNYENNVHPQLELTELLSMKIDIAGLDIPNHLLSDAHRTAETMYSHLLTSPSSITTNTKQLRLNFLFHNGWRVVNKCSLLLKQKQQLHKKFQQSSKVITNSKIKNYVCEDVGFVPFVFVEEEAVLIVQVMIRVEVKVLKEREYVHSVELPVGFCYYVIDKFNTENKIVKLLTAGNGLHAPVLPGQKSSKTVRQQPEISGKLQFYIQLQPLNKYEFSKHTVTNQSIINKSTNQIDKVMMQKQRMMRQNKKLKLQNRKKKIQLNYQIPLLDTTAFKQNLYQTELDKIREKKKQMEQQLRYVEGQIKEKEQANYEDYVQEEVVMGGVKNFARPEYKNRYQNAQYFKTALKPSKPAKQTLDDTIKVPQVSILRNFIGKFGQLPLQVIRTELLEHNYSYGVFFNWITFSPINSSILFPRTFIFRLKFFTSLPVESATCEVNPSTGQILIHEQQKGETDKIVYFQVPPNLHVQNCTHKFIELLSYMYWGEVQITVIDASNRMIFGEGFVPLRDLIRMRRNEVHASKELQISLHNHIKAILKLQIKCIRKQPTTTINSSKPVKNTLQQLSLTQEQRMQQRIQNYKNRHNPKKNEQHKINKLLSKNTNMMEIKVHVHRMKGELIWLQYTNRKNYSEEVMVTVNDPHAGFVQVEECMVVDELIWKRIESTVWWKFLELIGSDKQKMSKCKFPTRDHPAQVDPGQTVFFLLYYYSKRKPESHYHLYPPTHLSQPQLNKVYNYQHMISISLTNPSKGALLTLYEVEIIPEPDYLCFQFEYARKAEEKVEIQLPWKSQNGCLLYTDDPMVLVREEENKVMLEAIAGKEGETRRLEVAILSPVPDNRCLLNLTFSLRGCAEFYLEGELWEKVDFLVDFNTAIANNKGLSCVFAFPEDQKTIEIRDKNPIKVNSKQSKTMIRGQATIKDIEEQYHLINILDPQSMSILTQFTLHLHTIPPQISDTTTLNLRYSDKILEQPFNFRNENARKIKFRTFSTKDYILWVSGESFEADAKSDKKIKIKINAELVTDREVIILCFKGDKVKYFYRFILEMSNML